MNLRFTIDGSDALEATLRALCAEAAGRVLQIIPRKNIHALVLGGGYGRGEGGVLGTAAGEQPYNDLEFYILLEGNLPWRDRRWGAQIHRAAEELSHSAGVEIEFKLLPLRKLQNSPVSMFFYDLVSGHRLVTGSDAWVTKCDHHRAAHRLPLHEATRLLMNRCSGLYFSQERLRRSPFTAEDADFVGRNLAKTKLALGDVMLTLRGQYHWSCRERHKRLKKIGTETKDEFLASLVLLHEQGTEFKLHPIRTVSSPPKLAAELDFLKESARKLWLQLESRRLKTTFQSMEVYSTDPSSKCPETNPIKNRLINFRTFGVAGLLTSSYPRERLLRSLPLLLWHEPVKHLPLVRSQLRTNVTDPSALLPAYESLWRIYN